MTESRRRQLLQRMADHGDRRFDPATGALVPSSNAGAGAVSRAGCGDDSLRYALVLLELADRSLQGRAEAILRRALARKSGFGRSKAEGATLMFIWLRHRRRLDDELASGALHAVEPCIPKVDCGATDLFVVLALAEARVDPELLARGVAGLARLSDADAGSLCPGECLAGLHAITTYVRDARARDLAGALSARLWRDLTGSVPSSAASRLLGALIERAGCGARGSSRWAEHGGADGFDALPACVVNVEAPADVRLVLAARLGAEAPA